MSDTVQCDEYALVIGANGGIGKVIVKHLIELQKFHTVYALSRSNALDSYESASKDAKTRLIHKVMDTASASSVKDFIGELSKEGITFRLVICTTGILHQDLSSDVSEKRITLKPEKRLEDIQPEQLSEYFRINSILPAIWLQNLVNTVDKRGATIVFFSARVGSISENALGGWYGYRASKAALNMLVKTAAIEYKRRKPNTSLLCYHPGTVDTGLSKPFQANVAPGKLFTPDFTVQQLLSICNNLNPEQSPFYLDWQGKTIAW